jgi:hypothetical protein
MTTEALAMRVKCGCRTCERAASTAAPSKAAPSKRDAAHLTNTTVIDRAEYKYFAVDPCHAVIPGMPVGGWQPGEVVPHRRSKSYTAKNVLLVYTLCVRVRVHAPSASVTKRSTDKAEGTEAEGTEADDTEAEGTEADDTEADYKTEWKGAFEYYKTSSWDDFVAKHPEWSDIGHCYFLVLGGHYVPYAQWTQVPLLG